jgi:toxin ParE1/3/4
MKKALRLSAEARTEILEAAVWYDGERPGLGEAFVEAVDEALARVARLGPECRPAVGVPSRLGVKRVLVRKFPYLIIFVELPDLIRVLAVSHVRRKPGYWSTRR